MAVVAARSVTTLLRLARAGPVEGSQPQAAQERLQRPQAAGQVPRRPLTAVAARTRSLRPALQSVQSTAAVLVEDTRTSLRTASEDRLCSEGQAEGSVVDRRSHLRRSTRRLAARTRRLAVVAVRRALQEPRLRLAQRVRADLSMPEDTVAVVAAERSRAASTVATVGTEVPMVAGAVAVESAPTLALAERAALAGTERST